jgi:chemotaxis protein MotB
MSPQKTLVLIVRKKAHAGRHHGGAWKVAYADFVTALLALFIVLWLMNSGEKVRQAVSGYFRDPKGLASRTGTTLSGSGEAATVQKDDMPKLKQKLEAAMRKMENFARIHDQVQMTITQEGLRVELIETKGGFFFENGSSELTAQGKELLAALAREIAQLPNHLLIEGYTNAVPYTTDGTYTNWELSADRANSARRLMEQDGIRADQTSYIRGYADRELRNPSNPVDPTNRRVSIVIQYQESRPPQASSALRTQKYEIALKVADASKKASSDP